MVLREVVEAARVLGRDREIEAPVPVQPVGVGEDGEQLEAELAEILRPRAISSSGLTPVSLASSRARLKSLAEKQAIRSTSPSRMRRQSSGA